jgi:hypothetical protein
MTNTTKKRPFKSKKDFSIGAGIGIFATVIMSIFGPLFYDLFFNTKNEKENIILLGSGTVIQYLKQFKDATKKAHFLDGPSGTAFDILLSARKDQNNLQMIAMTSTMFDEKEYKKRSCNNKIVEVELPIKDEFMIFISLPDNNNNSYFDTLTNRDVIELKTIHNLITTNNLDFYLYLTTENSGTRIEFQKMFYQIDASFRWPTEKIKIFDLNANTLDDIKYSPKPCVILTSSLYKTGGEGHGSIIINNGVKQFRNLYLYFIKKDGIQPKNDGYTFNKDYLEGCYVEELFKKINPSYKLKLQNSFNDEIIKLKIE